jgi:tRNA nucleotidyltransferase/poly(A) polymerase
MSISDKILSDPVNKWVLKNSKNATYLVGGYLRDLLRKKQSRDKDFVIKQNAGEIARNTARKFKGTFIELKKNHTYRVAMDRKRFIDFTYLTDGIKDNLEERDFTINAIAWSPKSGIIAPPDYMDDIRNKVIRVVRSENLINDPLRVLRAYRLSSQLNFDIEKYTRKEIRRNANLIIKVSPERITEELFKVLNSNNSSDYLKLCLEDNVLSRIIPLTTYNISINLMQLGKLDNFLNKINKLPEQRQLRETLSYVLSQNLTRKGLIRLFLITRFNDNKFDSEHYNCDMLNNYLRYLNLSIKIKKGLFHLMIADQLPIKRITDKGLFQLFLRSGSHVLESAVIRTIVKSKIRYRFINRAKEYIQYKRKPILDGHEIKGILNIKSGEIIGQIKRRILEQQFLGNINNRKEAVSWIISNLT